MRIAKAWPWRCRWPRVAAGLPDLNARTLTPNMDPAHAPQAAQAAQAAANRAGAAAAVPGNASLAANFSLAVNASLANRTSGSHNETDIYAQEMLKHAGHEQTHSTMALILMLSLLLSQYAILFWKNAHPASFAFLSTLGMWLIPPIFAIYSSSWRFMWIWAGYAVINAGVIWKASERPLSSVTPRMVYKWYSTLYSVTYGLGSSFVGSI